MATIITASKDQVDKLYKKHCKPFFGIPKIVSKSYSCDHEDRVAFVKLTTITGKVIEFQVRRDVPMFISVSEFGNITYSISDLESVNADFYNLLKNYADTAKKEFWKGSQI